MTTRHLLRTGLIACSSLVAITTAPAWRLSPAPSALDVRPSSTHAQRSDTVVLASGAPLHTGTGTLMPSLEIGRDAMASEYQFKNVRWLSAGRDGSIFVVDWAGYLRDTFVRKYDKTGAYVRAYGRIGQGPGEFDPVVLNVRELSDGRVLVMDGRGILVYSAAGESQGRWNPKPGWSMQLPIYVDYTGSVVVLETHADTTRPLTASERPAPFLRQWLHYRTDGAVMGTIGDPRQSLPPTDVTDRNRPVLPFTPRTTAVFSPLGYFVTANTGRYAIDLRVPPNAAEPFGWRAGDPVSSIRRTTTPVPVQSGERADWRIETEYEMRSQRGGSWTWTGPDIPTAKPPISSILVAEDGRIWVQLTQLARFDPTVEMPTQPPRPGSLRALQAPERWREPVVYDVLEPSGRYIGRVQFPGQLSMTTIRGDTVWAVARDADDVPIVTRYRVRWGGERAPGFGLPNGSIRRSR
jgi:hypothetical protein